MTEKQQSDKSLIIEKLKDLSIMLSQTYGNNIQIFLDVNKTNRIAKIRITENIS
jgi:hypothetical protein